MQKAGAVDWSQEYPSDLIAVSDALILKYGWPASEFRSVGQLLAAWRVSKMAMDRDVSIARQKVPLKQAICDHTRVSLKREGKADFNVYMASPWPTGTEDCQDCTKHGSCSCGQEAHHLLALGRL